MAPSAGSTGPNGTPRIERVRTNGTFSIDGVEAAFSAMHDGNVLRSVVVL